MSAQVKVVSYDPSWSSSYKKESKRIKKILGDNCLEVHHIGSTAVPDLSSKPIIDILVVTSDLLKVDNSNQSFAELGYTILGESGMLFRRFFKKEDNKQSYNIHLYEKGDDEIKRYIKFRDWMKNHPEDRKRYENLKLLLAKKYPDDLYSYCEGKEVFVREIDEKDGYRGTRIVHPLLKREWSAFEKLKKQFLELNSLEGSALDSEQLHFVLYHNVEIVGAASLEVLEKKAELTLFVIDKACRSQGLGSQFLKSCERWLTHQKIETMSMRTPIHLKSFLFEKGFHSQYATDELISFEKKL